MKRIRVSALLRIETFAGDKETIESRRTVVLELDARKLGWTNLLPLLGLLELARPLFKKEKNGG